MKHIVSIPPNTFLAMQTLEIYNLNLTGRGLTLSGDRPCLSSPAIVQRGHSISNFFGCHFRWIRPLRWRGDKAVGRETLHTGGKIVTDIAENKLPEANPKDIVSNHVTESVENVIGNLRPGERKRARGVTSVTKKRKKVKRARATKRDIFSRFTSITRHHVRCRGRGGFQRLCL